MALKEMGSRVDREAWDQMVPSRIRLRALVILTLDLANLCLSAIRLAEISTPILRTVQLPWSIMQAMLRIIGMRILVTLALSNKCIVMMKEEAMLSMEAV